MAFRPKKIRGFKLRTQFKVGKDGKTSVKLVSSRKILSKGKAVTAGTDVKQNGVAPLVAKPKARIQGEKLRKA
ncbi:hypothetical protein [Nocardia phage P3.1]|nr:hypothetical protein [Nocardia phage P3.1]